MGDETGILSVGKSLTTRERISNGILKGLEIAAEPLGLSAGELLKRTALFIYGSTRATNAILEKKTARTALLVTEGFPDILVRREGGKLNPWDYSHDYPDAYVPRGLTFEVPERLTSTGNVYRELEEESVLEIIAKLRAERIEAVAVSFLWSVVNPIHELRVGQLLAEHLRNIPYTLSHQVNPILREYRRTSSAVLDASLKPLMQEHLREMESDIRSAGLAGELLPAISLGGVLHLDEVIAKPIHTVRSGPSLAPVLGQVMGAAEAGNVDVIVCDTGGTSFDVSLVRDGHPVHSRDTWLGQRYTGHLTGMSSVDARSIGAGGGSIARIDSGGLLCVGPASAGADPGPACYGQGGTEPTVTDAALVLGYLDPEYFNAGRMKLDVAAARQAVQHLATQIGKSIEDTAAGILTVAGEHMVSAIKELTINEGVDPRGGLLLAGGGAAGLNIVPIAQELGCNRVLVPRMAGALSACGAQFTNVVTEFGTSCPTQSRSFDFVGVTEALANLNAQAEEFELDLKGRGILEFKREYFVEAHYLYQVWDIEIALPSCEFRNVDDLDQAVSSFHNTHESIFAVSEPQQEIEFMHWKLRVTGKLVRPPLTRIQMRQQGAPKPSHHVPAYFMSLGTTNIPVYRGDALHPGDITSGPALIIEPTTTIVLYPGSSSVVTQYNNHLIQLT